jgi:FMN phosphatase YigB (HAD superfamily)
MVNLPALLSFDFGGTLDGTGLAPRERRWSKYKNDGFVFKPSYLISSHQEVRRIILQNPDSRNWALQQSVRMWFELETAILKIPHSYVQKWVNDFIEEEITLLKQSEGVLIKLRSQFVLAVISNNIGNLPLVLREVGLSDYFEAIIDSALCGYRKPDPKIFQHCQKIVQISNSKSCWHLGDSWRTDVLGSAAADWNSLFFCPNNNNVVYNPAIPRIKSLAEFVTFIEGKFNARR